MNQCLEFGGLAVSHRAKSCVRVEVDVLGSPSLISLMISVDVKHHIY